MIFAYNKGIETRLHPFAGSIATIITILSNRKISYDIKGEIVNLMSPISGQNSLSSAVVYRFIVRVLTWYGVQSTQRWL